MRLGDLSVYGSPAKALNRESRIARQPLVAPHRLELSPAQEQLAEAHLEVFRLNGFDLKRDEAKELEASRNLDMIDIYIYRYT